MTNGTLVADLSANTEDDCKRLYEAMKGLGTDEDAINDVLAHRSLEQRLNIVASFETMYGKSLKDWLKSELSGDHEKAILALLKEPLAFEAESLKKAMKGAGTNENALIQIIVTKSNKEINALKDIYKKLYDEDLKEQVESETSGDLRRVLISCLSGNRGLADGSDSDVDEQLADSEAQELFDAGEAQMGTDECVFTRILCSRHNKQLKQLFKSYNRLSGKSLYDVIDSEFSGDAKQALQALCLSAANKPHYLARELHAAMKGLGTDDEALIRIIVTRCERDLKKIIDKFEQVYEGDTFAKWVKGECSGDYKKLLLALINEQD